MHYAFIKNLVESNIEKVVVMGSMHEIGFYEGSINENSPTNPQSLYGISKDALRNLVKLKWYLKIKFIKKFIDVKIL